jgi:radical SAM superfamily enzyme YgiQ (UPF0313 family)
MNSLIEKGTRCLLIHPKCSEHTYYNFVDVYKLLGAKYLETPLGLLTVAALLPQQWEFKLLDENVEPLFDHHLEWADMVFIGSTLAQQQRTLSIIELVHQKMRPVVVGGPDPTSQPELYKTADFLVQNEGEITIPMLLEDLKKNCRSGRYMSLEKADMSKAVVPRFDLIHFKDYLMVAIQYSRGCPHNCEFCNIIEIYGRNPRVKSPEQIIKELQYLYDLGYRGCIAIVDDNFLSDKKSVKRLLPVIRKWSDDHSYPFYFSTDTSIALADEEEILQMMNEVDFRMVFIGIETPDNFILKQVKKNQNLNRIIEENVNKILSYGIVVNGGFVIGFDNEDDRIAEHMVECVQASGVCLSTISKLVALPNTQLTRRLQNEGRLFNDHLIQKNNDSLVDQTTFGLNFKTTRSRLDILNDFVYILRHVYHPQQYFNRLTHTCLKLQIANKYKQGIINRLKSIIIFLRVSAKVGFDINSGFLYWKMLLKVLLINPKAFETAVSYAALFLHLRKQSEFAINLTKHEITIIENYGEDYYNRFMFQKDSISNLTSDFLFTQEK